MDNSTRPRRIFIIFITALVALIDLSIVDWSKLTNNTLKDFNLISDILPKKDTQEFEETNEQLDPELANLPTAPDSVVVKVDTAKVELKSDTVRVYKALPDTFQVPLRDGVVLIEDYSLDGRGLARLKASLESSSDTVVRIAMVGDSYIEGDIFSQNIRAALQQRYGGCGVGLVGAYSQFPGFRYTIKQSCSAWKEHDITSMKSRGYRLLQGKYHTGKVGAKSTYKGTDYLPYLEQWNNTRMLYIATRPGTMSIKNDSVATKYDISAADSVQVLEIRQATSSLSLSMAVDSINVLGLWFDGDRGISLDNVSLRGNSGISHRSLSEKTTAQMRKTIDYKLIMLQFGLNAITAGQRNFASYRNAMIGVVEELQRCYPEAQILIIGTADRGQKRGGEVQSMTAVRYMVKAQRDVAHFTGSLFWDMRSAMGGDGSVIDWKKNGYINSDYIHLNHKGGAEMAKIFVESLYKSIDE